MATPPVYPRPLPNFHHVWGHYPAASPGSVREGHSPERVKEMLDHLERLKQQGIEAIEQ
jgi:hypothetical protein